MGVETDFKVCLEWYMKIAEQGNTEAMKTVGFSYEMGIGVEKNVNKAFEWYAKAVELGDKSAKKYLKRIKKLLEDT